MNESSDSLVRYFARLDEGDLDACIECFADDAVYSRPGAAVPSDASGQRPLITLHGKRAIADYLHELRAADEAAGVAPGAEPHTLTVCVRSGRFTFAEGHVPTGPQGGTSTFLALAEHDDDGRIARYVAMAMLNPELDEQPTRARA
jgi:ketosteroid isomerase-like protein